MVYQVIGLMSGSSLDGLDIVFVELSEVRGQWSYVIHAAECVPYDERWTEDLRNAVSLNARDYMLLHTAYGHYLGRRVADFITRHSLDHRVHFIASHGHTAFHMPDRKMTAQLGDGAAIAAETGLPVITDLRSIDVALGGQGAPIVPIGEQLLFPGYDYWLNLGGIANISTATAAFDVCPANSVLNALAGALGKSYDENGALAAGGMADMRLLEALNAQPYYGQPYPKSLSNDFGREVILPLIGEYTLSVQGKLRTYVQHIAQQVARAARAMGEGRKMLVTGGGAFNRFLVESIHDELQIDVIIPDEQTVQYKEALVMALIGALRWRQQPNVLASVTGASRDSVNGALWMGEA